MEIYWKGDKAKLTGNTQNDLGAKWHEAKLLEGHRKGELIWVIDDYLIAYAGVGKEYVPE